MSLMQVLTTRDTFQTTTTPYAFLASSATFLPDSRDISPSATSATDTFSSYFPATTTATRDRNTLLSSNVVTSATEHFLTNSTTSTRTIEDLKLSNTSTTTTNTPTTVRELKEKPATPIATWNASSSQEQHTMNNLQHVAQQSRREKLRIPGSPQSGNHSEHAGESLESPGMRSSYGANPGPGHQDMLSVYNNQLLAGPELYSYTTGSELLNAVSGKNQGYLIAGTDGLSQVYSAPGGSFQTSGNVISKGGGSWSANLNGQLGQFSTNSLPPTTSSGIPGALLIGSGLQSSTAYGSTTGRDLGSYFTGGAANAQDAMHLYLMNAAGFPSYPDNSAGGGAGGSMVFIPGPSNGSQGIGSAQVGSVSGNSPVGYNQGGRASYTGWKNGDELVFMPGSERAKSLIGSSQEGGLNEFSAAEYGLRDTSLAGQHVENSQRLSLTLSSQQPALHAYDVLQQSGLDSPAGLSQDGKRPGKLGADLSHFRTDYNQGKQMHLDTTTSSAMSASFNIISSSRYLKACQQLLEEVCSVGGKGVKPGVKASSKAWTGASPLTSPTSVTNKDGGAATTGTTTTTTTTRGEESQDAKDGATATAPTSAGTASGTSGAAAATASGAGGAAASGAGEGGESTSALGAEEKQELETKKSKLVAMLQEVDRRYRQYYDQMQVVISSFDAVAGVGAATPYTALALQAMSRYFRCLKDAITGQISLVCKSLGEEDISKQITTRSPTSRLRFIDQQIRQQRAFQQLGMLNQHAWRPQRGLPERSVSILRAWLFEHFLHPYPKDADKMLLARQTGLTRSQVSNWFINARVRLWKPMVEEMYQEETREQELDIAVSRLNAAAESEADGNTTSVTTATTANAPNEIVTLTNNDYPKSTSAGQFGHETSASDNYLNPALRKQSLTSDSSQLYDETSQQMKKSRYTTTSGLHESNHLLTSSMDVDLKPGTDDGMQESHHQLANGALQHHFGYDQSQLRFTNGAAAGFRYNLNPGGVSLTLGLQHSDGLAAQQQAYLQGGQGAGGAAAGFHLTSRRETGGPVTTEHDFSSLYDNAAAAAAGLHDGMSYSSRKHMESQLLHDFVPS